MACVLEFQNLVSFYHFWVVWIKVRNVTLNPNQGLIWPCFHLGPLLCFYRLRIFPSAVTLKVRNVVLPSSKLGYSFSVAHLDLIYMGTALTMCLISYSLRIYYPSNTWASCSLRPHPSSLKPSAGNTLVYNDRSLNTQVLKIS